MPRLDLILLPLLGGYIFLITFNLTRYYHKRIEKNRLIYNSLLFAFVAIGTVYLLDYLFLKVFNTYSEILCVKTKFALEFRNYVSLQIDNVAKFSKPGFKQSLVVLFLSYPLAYLLNKSKYFQKDFSFDYTLNKFGNEYEKIIWNTLGEANDLDKLLMVTTKSNKVYIGQITKLSDPIENTHIKILPSMSGYRDKETQKLTVTTSYIDVIAAASQNDQTERLDSKLGVIIPMDEISLISRFDYELFGQFNAFDNSELEGQSI